MRDVILEDARDVLPLFRDDARIDVGEVHARVHVVLIPEEAVRVVVRGDAVHQFGGVVAVERRAALPVDEHTAKIEHDVGDGLG